jgi:hypothetical protein
MLCGTPWAMVTPAGSLFSSSSFLHGRGLNHGMANETNDSPDGELEVPWDDARLPVVAHGVAGQLEDLSGQVLHHGGHVDWGAGSHPTLLA